MSDEEWNNFGEKLGVALLGAILFLFLLLSLCTRNVNFAYCPGVAETPAAATINWRVVR